MSDDGYREGDQIITTVDLFDSQGLVPAGSPGIIRRDRSAILPREHAYELAITYRGATHSAYSCGPDDFKPMPIDDAFQTTGPLPCPPGETEITWAGACALAALRHPQARYPQPADVADSRTVTAAVVRLMAERLLP